jgi:two-component system, NtrC family, response regulator HydG
MTHQILVVDDEQDTAMLLRDALRKRGFAVEAMHSAAACLEYLQTRVVDVVVTDVQMPGMSGIALCQELSIRHPDSRAIVLTGVGDIEKAVGAIRAGAHDFITKPVRTEVLEIAIRRALDHLEVKREVNRLRRAIDLDTPIEGLAGSSRPIKTMVELIRRAAPSDATVLITGESGTGKELVAKALHSLSPRAAAPFIALNCAAVPGPLLESELFGHVRGAFTDAKRSRGGLFAQAGAGTIFLDEIGEMPIEMQTKLLRVLQERKVRPVGSDEEIEFECRVVVATNRDLEAEVAAKRFREDLYHRINVVGIPVPALRERGPDILELAKFFLERICRRANRATIAISPAAAQKLASYDWPGNVRELENSMERAVALARNNAIEVEDLPAKILSYEPSAFVVASDAPQEMITIDEMERRYVRAVLAAVQGNKTHAARILGIDRRSLYRRLEATQTPEAR